MYPLDKYHFHTTPDNRVIAVSSFAGKAVKGVAKCDSRGTFSLKTGKELAAARCAAKVAKRRFKHAEEVYKQALSQLRNARGEHDWRLLTNRTRNASFWKPMGM